MTAFVPALTETDLKKIVLAIQQIGAGRSNAVGTVTLTPSSATTTVSAANSLLPTNGLCAPGSVPILIPMTASAATEFGAGTWFISAVGIDTFTIAHVNSAVADRTFRFAVVG